MEPRAANSRPSRLSLIADLRAGPLPGEGQTSPSAVLRSTMDWDEDEGSKVSPARKNKSIPRWRKLAEKASRKTLLGIKTAKDLSLDPSANPSLIARPKVRANTNPMSPPGRAHNFGSPLTILNSAGIPPRRGVSQNLAPPLPKVTQPVETPRYQKSSSEENTTTTHSSFEENSPSSSMASPTSSHLARPTKSPRALPAVGASTTSLASSTPRLDPGDDPSWNASVARVKEQMREEQDKERRERRAQATAEMRAIRAAVEPERKFRWGRSAIDKLMVRSSAYGWHLKGDPNGYTDEEWTFIMDVLNKDDTTPLRDRLFEKIGTTGIHSSAVQKFVERHQQPSPSSMRSPPIGLGIRHEDVETPEEVMETTLAMTKPSTEEEALLERQRELRAMPSLPDSLELSDTSSMCRRRSLEALTNGFETKDFDPRMSKVLSIDVKKYLKVPPGTVSQQTDKKAEKPVLAVRKISDPATPGTTARELSALKTAAAMAGYRNVRDAADFQSIIDHQEQLLAQIAKADKEQAITENAEEHEISTETTGQPKVIAVQRPSKIPKPGLSSPGSRLRTQSLAARSHESLIPKPSGMHPALRLRAVASERKLTAIHPALRPTARSEPAAPIKTTPPITKSSLRKTQSAIGLASGFQDEQTPSAPAVPKSDPTSRKTSARTPVPLKFARDGVVPTVPGSPPSSPDSTTSVLEIIGPITEHPAFQLEPQDRRVAKEDFFFNRSTLAQLPAAAALTRSSSMVVSASSSTSAQEITPSALETPADVDNSDVFGPEGMSTHAPACVDAIPQPPILPTRNPARLRDAATFSMPLQQKDQAVLNQPPHDSMVGILPSMITQQNDTPTRSSKIKPIADLELSAAVARAETLRQLSSDGSEGDDCFDSETDRPLSDLFTSREEWIRTGPSSDSTSFTPIAPGRLYLPPQVLESVSRMRTTAQQQGLSLSIPRNVSADTSNQHEGSPVPAPLRTSSSTFGFITPARTRNESGTTETPSRRPTGPPDRSVSVPIANTQHTASPVNTLASAFTDVRSPIDNIPTPSRSILRPPMTSQEHLERVRRDQERMMVTETIRLGQALNSPNLTSATSAPLAQFEFPSPRPSRSTRPETAASNHTTTSSIRSKPRFGNLFNTDPIEQYAFDRRERKASGARTRLSAEFDSVHSMLEHMSPTASKQSRESARSSRSDTSIERDFIRHDLGLRPLRDCEPGEPCHPKHPYEWDTVKVMCRNIHNPGTILPPPPDIPSGRPVHMSDYADEFFVGSPHTVTPTIGPRKCRTCPSYCCHYADLLAHSEVPTTDIVAASSSRRVKEAVECLRVRKPNGMEEFETFLQCSFCLNEYCPKCIVLCKEGLCQQPICRWCREATEFCDDHNIF